MLTKTGQAEAIALQQEAATRIGTLFEGVSDTSDLITRSYKAEAEAQALLIQNSKNLNEEELKTAQLLQEQLQKRIDLQAETSKTVNNQVNSVDSMQRQIFNLNHTTNRSLLPEDHKALRTLEDINNLQDFQDQETKMMLSTQLSSMLSKTGLEQFKQDLNEIDFSVLSEKGKEAFETLRKEIQSGTLSVEQIQQKIKDFGTSGLASVEDMKNAYKDINAEIAKLQAKSQAGSLSDFDVQRLASLQAILPVIRDYIGENDKLSLSLAQLQTQTGDVIQAQKMYKQYLEEAGVVQLSVGQQVSNYARIISTLYMSARNISNVIKTLNDESKPLGERIGTLVGSMAMMAPMIINLGAPIAALGKHIYGVQAAMEGVPAATIAATQSTMTFGTALTTVLGAALPVVLVLGSLIAAFMAYKELTKAVEVETLADSINRLQDEVSSLTDYTTELRDKIDK